jgi:hypothetical protein
VGDFDEELAQLVRGGVLILLMGSGWETGLDQQYVV